MSNAVNFNNMPVNYGLLYAFDCNTYVDGAETWDNSVSGGKAATVVGGTIYMDGSVFFASGVNFAYWINDQSYKDSTKYFIAKALNTPSKSSYYWAFTERGASSSYTTDIDVYGSTGVITLYCNASASSSRTSIVSTDYHVITTTKSGTTARIYVDGVKYFELTGKTAFTPTNYGIGTASTTGNTPTESDNDLYVKCALVCNAAHSEGEILQNSNWLLEQYGLKSPEKNSRLAGTDAVAIAYAIARNQESMASLQQIKKSYRDGVKQGVKDGADTHEDHTDPNTDPIGIETDEDGNTKEPYIGDLTKGLYFCEAPTSSGGDRRYVHMWLDMSYIRDANEWVSRGQIVYDAYDSEGNLIVTQTTIGVGNICWRTDWKYKKAYSYIYNVKIDGSTVTCYEVGFYDYDNFKPHYYHADWSPWSTVAEIMKNSTVRTTLPPTE